MKHPEIYTCDFCGKELHHQTTGFVRRKFKMFVQRFPVFVCPWIWYGEDTYGVPTRHLCYNCDSDYKWELSKFNNKYLREHDIENKSEVENE